MHVAAAAEHVAQLGEHGEHTPAAVAYEPSGHAATHAPLLLRYGRSELGTQPVQPELPLAMQVPHEPSHATQPAPFE